MNTSYNRFAGQSVERLAALSDGVFAVAMTLLVLDLRAPAVEAVHSERDLWLALGALAPRLIMCAMAFMTLGIFWVGQQTQLNHLTRSGRSLSWMHIVFLFAVGRLHLIPDRAAGLLGKPAAVGRHATSPGCARRASVRCAATFPRWLRHQAPHRHRTVALRLRRAALLVST